MNEFSDTYSVKGRNYALIGFKVPPPNPERWQYPGWRVVVYALAGEDSPLTMRIAHVDHGSMIGAILQAVRVCEEHQKEEGNACPIHDAP